MKRNFLREFLQVSVVQFELYLRELDGDFNSIHVRVMHDACESSLAAEYHDYTISPSRQETQIPQLTETAFSRLCRRNESDLGAVAGLQPSNRHCSSCTTSVSVGHETTLR